MLAFLLLQGGEHTLGTKQPPFTRPMEMVRTVCSENPSTSHPSLSLFITTQAEKKKKDASEVKKLKLELFSPAFSVAALIATTAYITVQAVGTLVPAPPCNSSGVNISTAAMEMDMDPTLGGAGGGRWARGDGGVGGGGGSSHYFTGGEAPPPPLLPCEESDVRAVFPFPRCNPFLCSSIV